MRFLAPLDPLVRLYFGFPFARYCPLTYHITDADLACCACLAFCAPYLPDLTANTSYVQFDCLLCHLLRHRPKPELQPLCQIQWHAVHSLGHSPYVSASKSHLPLSLADASKKCFACCSRLCIAVTHENDSSPEGDQKQGSERSGMSRAMQLCPHQTCNNESLGFRSACSSTPNPS